MIGVFLGEQNEGKTLSMTSRLYEAYKKGFKVYANYNLEFPHKKITKKLLEEWTKDKKHFNKAVFGIDEIYLILDSRSSTSKTSKIFSYFLLQTSKRDVHLFCTAQYINTIEKRLRNNLKFYCHCTRVLYNPKTKDFEYLDNFTRIQDNKINKHLYIRNDYFIRTKDNNNLSIIKQKTVFIRAERIFNKYNTKQLIDIN